MSSWKIPLILVSTAGAWVLVIGSILDIDVLFWVGGGIAILAGSLVFVGRARERRG